MLIRIPSSIYLAFNAPSTAAGIVYAGLIFSVYTGILLVSPLKYKMGLSSAEVCALEVNPFIHL
jgi:hypothetical protein